MKYNGACGLAQEIVLDSTQCKENRE